MNAIKMIKAISKTRLLLAALAALSLMATAYAATPGITGPTFNLTAQAAYITQPDGQAIYSWGYGCNGAPSGYAPVLTITPSCGSMQIPGPTLIVTEGDAVSVTLTNNLPAAAGNTSILFPGFQVTASGGLAGLKIQEAAPGGAVTYSFTAMTPGTHAYFSGTQSDLQIEMGLFGAIIVRPIHPGGTGATNPCTTGLAAKNLLAQAHWGEVDTRLAVAAYDHPKTCYDREYLFQLSEMDPEIHHQAEVQVAAKNGCAAGAAGCTLNVSTEPYHPVYFLVNGRSAPDIMDTNYAVQYPHQPYNGNPHMHPGEMVLLRIIGQGRTQHPFHEHANHVRILARDGNLLLTPDGNGLAGPLFFTTDSTPGEAFDGLFIYTGKGMNYDMYGHNPQNTTDPLATLPCIPDANGFNTGDPTAINYFEWCQDHNKPMQVLPFGDVASGGPVTLPDPTILTNGPWFGGSPYLGPDATTRATYGTCAGGVCTTTGTTPPSGTVANSPSSEAGFSFMWHSHNEREITTDNIFPGGMLMMMLVDSREFLIDESN
jgi:FtsP/CotA-like multicopper oxidase with cupredoxin domain